MAGAETTIRDLLHSAGIEVNGPNPWDLQVHNEAFYNRVLRGAALGLGESYMDGWWDCPALDQFFVKVCLARLDKQVKGNWKILLHALRAKLFNLQNIRRAYQIGEKHYDLGNDFYIAMLDQRMNYTCAYWKHAVNLDEAQEAKLELVCRKIGLQPGMSVLELGCGFGAFAGYAAEKYDVEVTGVTVSRRQVEYANEHYKDLPVTISLEDYRHVHGSFDRVISIGILEHVGFKNYRTYMKVVDRTLKKWGLAFIHTIGQNGNDPTTNAWTTKYIFTNSVLPSVARIGAAMAGIFVLEDWHNFGPDYDRTLMAWHANFVKAWPDLSSRYDDRFYRMWSYYLLSAAGGFRARYNNLWQIVMSREGTPLPDCRMS